MAMPISGRMIQLSLSLIVILFFSSNCIAQPMWLTPQDGTVVSFEFLKIDKYKVNPTNLSSVTQFSGRIKLNSQFYLMLEIPFAHYKPDSSNLFYYNRVSQYMFGNPYIGLEYSNNKDLWYCQFGFRPPFAYSNKNDVDDYARLANYNKAEAFTHDVLSIYGKTGIKFTNNSNISYNFLCGPAVIIPTVKEDEDDGSEIYLDVLAQMTLTTPTVRFKAGISGRYWVSAAHEADGLDERSIHIFGFSADFGSGRFRPGIQLRFPLDDDLEDLNLKYVFGMHLMVQLN